MAVLNLKLLRFKRFQLGVSGFFVFNTGSSDLTKADSITKQLSRYETSLFDVEDLSNKNDIDRLEELYLKYSFSNSHVVFGKQLINTPFTNMQDSRMRPTEVEGIWTEIDEVRNLTIKGGFLYHISPRSTTKWYDIGESMGIYSTGFNVNGSKSNYAGNIESGGVVLLGLTYHHADNLKLQLWEQYVDNVFNTTMEQIDFSHAFSSRSKIFAALQSTQQFAIKNGGNEDSNKSYVTPGSKSFTFGARIGWKSKTIETTVNYNRITKHGRFLMPREWGTEPFFTYLSRERNEGLGDVQAVTAKVNYNFAKHRLHTSLAAGYYKLPGVNNFPLNKYAMPSYNQINADVRYEFEGLLKGLESQLLFVYKGNREAAATKASIINKVNMASINLIFNYHF